jgi:hypothetical protein
MTMRRKLTEIALVAVTAIVLTAATAAAPVTAKERATRQRIAIQSKADGSFVLVPLTSGSMRRDTGSAAFCCWTETHVTRDGQAIDIDDPQMTLTSTRGKLIVRNPIGFVDIPGGWAVFTGTWKIVRGTGDYAGISGGGRAAGIMLADGSAKSTFEGFITPS